MKGEWITRDDWARMIGEWTADVRRQVHERVILVLETWAGMVDEGAFKEACQKRAAEMREEGV